MHRCKQNTHIIKILFSKKKEMLTAFCILGSHAAHLYKAKCIMWKNRENSVFSYITANIQTTLISLKEILNIYLKVHIVLT